MSADESTPTQQPLLRVVSGNPTDEDLAVLVTVFAGASGGSGGAAPRIRDDWGHPVVRLRPTWNSPTGFTNLRW
ncbi:acyl-CoA carboxylase subunit epsilon [Gordonia sp. CPCC 205333]